MGLFGQTVTVYRADGSRRVIPACALQRKHGYFTDEQGTRLRDRFTLIVPGAWDLRPGDRLLEGVGPDRVDWAAFLPETVEGVCQIGYVQPFFWAGRVTHVEAGGQYDRY